MEDKEEVKVKHNLLPKYLCFNLITLSCKLCFEAWRWFHPLRAIKMFSLSHGKTLWWMMLKPNMQIELNFANMAVIFIYLFVYYLF